ncbi:hypothetical protein L249_7511 [Ophiocordyceps polyrhachis-furcata BCC 54312]|uniref:U3 small nucleolar RNA-associated protein 22 n=1 Tax=Ophiocordyceps polyrhachis-furcata BCC 54312 TaxID=1330021 RepID=A0A367LB12_9HYPO|nr:hypothetical protein L249_7511 [Ophiocordyceps polyrhachis-furcata BCC 54312]
MESSSKRRKIDHADAGLRHHGLIDFQAPSSTQLSTATAFVLQTDQLLKEARLDYGKALGDVDGHLFRLKQAIEAIEPHEPLPIGDATASLETKHKLVVPYPDPKPPHDAPYKMAYQKPAQCNVVGSYVSRTMINTQPAVAVDMVVQMPTSLFQEKDYSNMRYFYRRAYYIAYIAVHLRSYQPDSMSLGFELLNDNLLLPVLVLRPRHMPAKAKTGEKKPHRKSEYSIRLIPCAPDELFPWSKLTPTTSCIRVDANGSSSPTPFYNSTLNAERTFITYLRLLSHAKNQCPAFADACILGRIWLQQRGFGGAVSQGGFGHFQWSVVLALLLLGTGDGASQASLSTSLSCTELFKAMMQFLSTADLSSKALTLGAPTAQKSNRSIREPGPVLFDPIRELNVAFYMTPWSTRLLQQYAKSTADLLSDNAAQKFEAAFIVRADVPSLVYDAVFEIHSPETSKRLSTSADRSSAASKLSSDVYRILNRAYGERCKLIHVQQKRPEPWSLHVSMPRQTTDIVVGLIFDPAHMSRQMEHGPPAEHEKEAAAFRQFWGDKAELRRFKDGSILECVEWTGKLAGQICEEMARFALKRHLKTGQDELVAHGDGFSSSIGLSHLDKEAFDAASRAFSTLERDIRGLADLPLQIRQLSPVSPAARYSSIELPTPPRFHKGRTVIQPMDVNLYFEASGKWPENLTAIQEAKVDFLLDIDRRLTTTHKEITTYLGREDREVGIENLVYLDIVYDDDDDDGGAAFRLRVLCDLEETLLQRRADDDSKTLSHGERDQSVRALHRFRWLHTTLPLHTQLVATWCTRMPALSPSIRLARHWLESHKLGGHHVSAELMELVVLHVFLQPHPWPVPSSAASGFLRALFFLSRWDWRDEPLIVEPASSLTADERASLRRELESWRRRDPLMNDSPALFVATAQQASGQAYSRNGPSKLVASRMTRLAKAACKLVRQQGLRLDPRSLFQTSLRDYDVIIHLSSKAVRDVISSSSSHFMSSISSSSSSRYKNLITTPRPIRTHPLDVLASELTRIYDGSLIFFRGPDSDSVPGPVLAAIWCPSLPSRPVRFRPGLPFNFCRADEVDDDDDDRRLVRLNRDSILLEIARVGGHLISRIEVLDDDDEGQA